MPFSPLEKVLEPNRGIDHNINGFIFLRDRLWDIIYGSHSFYGFCDIICYSLYASAVSSLTERL